MGLGIFGGAGERCVMGLDGDRWIGEGTKWEDGNNIGKSLRERGRWKNSV